MTELERIQRQYRDTVECKIARKVYRALKRAGIPPHSVYDFYGGNPEKCSTENEFLDLLADRDMARCYVASGQWFAIINGEEWDALSDYTLGIEDVLQPVNDWIDQHN